MTLIVFRDNPHPRYIEKAPERLRGERGEKDFIGFKRTVLVSLTDH